jgi:broad specificity phosphatase PhoE
MVRVVLIRPGTTDFDEQKRIKGTLDIPLNESGNQQIQRTAGELSNLSIEVVFAAPCRAAEETAQLLSQSLRVRTKTIPDLRNLDPGLWQGKRIDEVKSMQRKVYRQWQEQPETVCPPDGEMLAEARQRMQLAIDKLLRKHRSGAVALVVPEPLASLTRSYLDHSDLGDLWEAENTCGQWEMIDVETA